MATLISYSNIIDGTLQDATVTLSDANATFGIKEAESGAVTVAAGASTTRDSLGVYTATFNPVPNVMYVVSWKIVMGGNTRYEQEVIGPFLNDGVRVAPEKSGTFAQGGWGNIMLRIMDRNGQPFDPENLEIEIKRDGNTIVTESSPMKLQSGLYLYDWQIAGDAEVGDYDVFWRYTVEDAERTQYQKVTVVANGNPNAQNSGLLSVFRLALENMILSLQTVPIEHEQCRPSHDNRTYRCTFPRWNQAAGVTVWRNNKVITSGYEIDYLNGKITFDGRLLDSDVVFLDYNFRYFTDDQLNLFLRNGLNKYNQFSPHSSMDFGNLIDRQVPAVLQGAVVDAIRYYLQSLIMPQNRAIFESAEEADKAFDHWESIKKSYEDEWKELVAQKKFMPYAGRTAILLHSMWNLPGGRARFFRYMFGGGGM